MLRTLPATSLACLLFKLIASIKTLRVYGPEPINASFARHDSLMRSDVELAFEKLLLLRGPNVFVAMLVHARSATKDLTVGYVRRLLGIRDTLTPGVEHFKRR